MKALDAALTALDEARAHLEAALRAADYDPRELERIEERLFALRAAGRKYNVAGRRPCGAGARATPADLAAIDAGAEELQALEAAAREAEARLSRKAAAALSAARAQGGREARQGGERRSSSR